MELIQAKMKLSADIIDSLQKKFPKSKYSAGTVVIKEGDPGRDMYLVIEGNLDVSLHGNVLDHLYPGDIFGEMALVSDITRSGSVTASTDCQLITITSDQFQTLVTEVKDFSRQVMAVMAIRLQHWMEEEVQLQRLEQELAIGHNIQVSLLPISPPKPPGWQFATHYRASKQVGGDFYDFIELPHQPDSLGIIVADVSGKGVPAALFMAVARTMIRAESRNCQSSAETLNRTNALIQSDNRSPLFLSALHATLNLSSGVLKFASAGHEMPLIYQNKSGSVSEFKSGGIVLGAFNNITYQEQEVWLELADVVLFYTDGITESRSPEGLFFGEERLESLLKRHSHQTAERIKDEIVKAVTAFTSSSPQTDDLTLIVIKRAGQNT